MQFEWFIFWRDEIDTLRLCKMSCFSLLSADNLTVMGSATVRHPVIVSSRLAASGLTCIYSRVPFKTLNKRQDENRKWNHSGSPEATGIVDYYENNNRFFDFVRYKVLLVNIVNIKQILNCKFPEFFGNFLKNSYIYV